MVHQVPAAGSSFAGDIDWVIAFIYVICGAWFFLAEGVLVYTLVRFRRREGVRAAWMPADRLRTWWAVLVPVGLVLVCDFAIEVAAAPVWAAVKERIPEHDVLVRITGRQFSWSFLYPGPDGALDTADDVLRNELIAPVDKVVRFQLESADVLHAFYVPELRLKQDAVPGRSIAGWFRPTLEGEFTLACAELCGVGHTLMQSKLRVVPEAEFERTVFGGKEE